MPRLLVSCTLALAAAGALALPPASAPAAAPCPEASVGAASVSALTAGADLRVRYDFSDNAPAPGGVVSPGYQSFYRMRTRLWGEARGERAALYARLANEFREYDNAPERNPFPDELFIDSLYLDLPGCWGDRADLRVGRQDLRYGAGRVIRDGSAGDGSRSTYFDAVRTTLRLSEKNMLDLFGVCQRPEDHWTLGGERYDLTSLTGGENNDLTETAAGAYLTLGEQPAFPAELYAIWKDESRSFSRGDRAQRVPGRGFLTAGTRLTPAPAERLALEFEGAAQCGETDDGRDILAFLGYAGALYKLAPDHALKPTVKGGLLYLSGDENAKAGQVNNWNPVFNRTTWISELSSSQYAKLYWTNLLYPHLEAAVEPGQAHRVSLEAGPMFAAENDTAQEDSYRGLLGVAKYQFPLLKGFFRKESEVKGTVLAEVFDAGDYYADAETGYYLRFELAAKF